MHLQGRKLTFGIMGDDVTVLHRELIQLGFTIPSNELKEHIFGEVTKKVVTEFQIREPVTSSGKNYEIPPILASRRLTSYR